MGELKTAAARLHSELDKVIESCTQADQRCFGESCDAYREAAVSFAAKMLSERIRQSFFHAIDPHAGSSRESAAEKIQHARMIRGWLAPWNLGFYSHKTGALLQLNGSSNGTRGGVYRLAAYGQLITPEITRWNEVKEILQAPDLRDVTDFVHHRNRSLSR